MLRLWNHPKTKAARIYFSFDVVREATDNVKGEWRYKDVKVWLESSREGGADIHTIVKGADSISDDKLDSFQAAVLSASGLAGNEAWDELVLIAQSQDSSESHLPDHDIVNRKQSDEYKSNRKRQIEAGRLDLTRIQFPGKTRIAISSNESELIRSLISTHPDVSVRREDLDVADFKIVDDEGNTLLIERQRCTNDGVMTDFERSLKTKGRLFEKADKLSFIADNSDQQIVPVLIMEGSVYENSGGLLIQQIDGAIAFLASSQRISVLNTVNASHSAHVILKLAAAFVAGGIKHEKASRQKPKMLFDQKINILRAIPGVDTQTAETLLKQFGSIKGLAVATHEELATVKGIGPKRATDIIRALGAL